MKLTHNQLQAIQNGLLDSGIKYQDFFEEIYDHYITFLELPFILIYCFQNLFRLFT